METVCKQNQCTGCMACVESCTRNAIRIEDAIDSYNAVINREVCINCGLCHRTCPNNKPAIKHEPIEWCEGWASDDIRENSSSGGAASAVIKTFIEHGGYVASCLFKKGCFSFEITNNMKETQKFSGSKYVKSNPLGIYKKIKLLLSQNEKVLFLGLPCQVAGLKNYLNLKNDDNLYTIDLICHGSPSPKILDLFLRENNVDIECVKAYSMDYPDESLVPYLRLLDAIKDMKRIPGTTGQDIYNRVKSQYFNGYSLPELEKIVSLAKSYPPRVRKVVADILGDIRQTVLQTEMAKTILPTTRFNLDYKTA